jgi:hypothetical protein
VNQRWRDRLGSFRPDGEPIRTSDYDVAPISDDTTAKAFVERHHYSGSFPAARERVGLFRRGELVGVAVFSVPCRDEVLTRVFPNADESCELGRFVLLDEVPGNGETWFLARAFRYMRAAGYCGVLSFSDPFARATLDGRTVFAGHIGTIYQAGNATYLGTGPRRSIKLLPDGRVFSARAISKVRAGERGWRHAAKELVAHGAPEAPEESGARREWLARWLGALTRTVRHPGNHKYAWSLHRAISLPSSKPYPKRTECVT